MLTVPEKSHLKKNRKEHFYIEHFDIKVGNISQRCIIWDYGLIMQLLPPEVSAVVSGVASKVRGRTFFLLIPGFELVPICRRKLL